MSVEERAFGRSGLRVSAIGFGAWAIGGPADAGGKPIGWGASDDATALRALERAREVGISFFDTADVYGYGHSEELIGQAFGNRPDVVIASKVGQVQRPSGLEADYSEAHVIAGCEASLRRLRRETIDLYQLHTVRVPHLEAGECVAALERLREQGKIRAWGVSLRTFDPAPEAEWLMQRGLGQGFQLVLNVINRRALPLLKRMAEGGYGVIARMPLQFGVLGGRWRRDQRFPPDDHRSFRFPPELLSATLDLLESEVFPIGAERGLAPDALAMGFAADFQEVSTLIPGIRTPEQAERNAAAPARLPPGLRERILALSPRLDALMERVERQA
jgi:aryl-alcohol dehydrogenase-like predicted oxidoreductase